MSVSTVHLKSKLPIFSKDLKKNVQNQAVWRYAVATQGPLSPTHTHTETHIDNGVIRLCLDNTLQSN